jgi:hypothetical protein
MDEDVHVAQLLPIARVGVQFVAALRWIHRIRVTLCGQL